MDRLINKIIRIFKKRYFVVVFLFVCIITLLGVTYSYWTAESGWKLASQIKFKELTYIMNIDDVNVSTINVSANSGTTYYDIEITSLNEINTRYLLVYNSDVSTVEVALSSSSINDASGVIGLYESGAGGEKTKNIRIAITNETSSAAIIELEVVGGYTWNPESAIDVTTGYNRIDEIHDEVITRGLTLAEELNQIMGCTPTSSSACLMKENSANYLTYSSKSWRIIGTYLVGGEYVTKLILNEPLTTKVTYANAASELTTFYNTLDTSLIKTSAPFVCTGTTNIACTGSANIGLISKAEYDVIKGVNSYLYTKPNKEYWLNDTYYTGTSRGAVNTDSSSLSYVRPVIYLKSNTIETAKTSTSTSITNLVTNGGFENGTTGWTNHASAYVTTSSNDYSNGNYSLKVEFTSVSSALIDSSQMSTPVGHIIYAKGAYKITSISATQPLGEIYGITDSVTYWQPGSINPSINNTGAWFTISTRFTSQHPTSFIRLGFWNANNQNYTGYHDDVMLIDLTATFGAGNEPSKAWCDENLEYFDGTTTINTKVGTVGTSGTPYTVTAGIQLTVNLNGGSSNIKSGYYQAGSTYSFTEPTKSLRIFDTWTVAGTGTSATATSVTIGTTNSTLTANWMYRIDYELNGGTLGTANPIKYSEETATFTLNNPSKTGYNFTGWTGSNGTTPQTTVTISQGSSGNKTYTANYVPIEYAINYTLNDGTNSSSNAATYNIETATFTLAAPTRTDYSFIGWTGSNGTTPQSSVTVSVGSIGEKNYTANWQQTVTTFYYINNTIQTFTPSFSGIYKLEVWGAQGGSVTSTYYGGQGGYSTGNIQVTQPIFVCVGGAGIGGTTVTTKAGGYNGGGSYTLLSGTDHWAASGGGATHISSTNRGTLVNYASYQSEIYIVAGGGGGGYDHSSSGYCGAGGAGGGTTGGNSIKPSGCASGGNGGTGGSQSAGGTYNGSFGLGGNPNYSWGSAGGGGWYGGGASNGYTRASGNTAGAGGSGYIGGVISGTGSTTTGGRSGDGLAIITYIGPIQ